MSKQFGLAVVGYGMGATHAQFIKKTPGLKLQAVCDVDEAALKRAGTEHPGATLYAAYAEVLADPSVDAAIIVTPHNTHAEMAIQAMDAGKHAVTDKAMCLTVAEACAMIAARDRAGVLLSTFHNRRWDSDFVTVRSVIEQGRIGRLQHIQSTVTGAGRIGGWRQDRARMGGWMYDWGAHTVDQILLLANSRPLRVSAFTHYRTDDPTTVEDYINCTIFFESGLTATTVVGYINHLPMPRWYVMGDRGTLQSDGFDTPVRLVGPGTGTDGETTVPLTATDWRSYYENLREALAGREPLAVQPEQLVPQIAIAEAAYRSVASGRTEDV